MEIGMNTFLALGIYLLIGTVGGLIGMRIKLPGGIMVGAMLAVILFKVISHQDWSLPKHYNIVIQILVGVMVGASYNADIARAVNKVIGPVIVSTLVLVFTGVILALIFTKLNLLDVATSYLSTSPGALSSIFSLAVDANAHPPIVAAFHFFRVIFIILTAPLVLKILQIWMNKPLN